MKNLFKLLITVKHYLMKLLKRFSKSKRKFSLFRLKNKQILKEIEVAETFDKSTLAKVPSEAKSSETIKPKFDIHEIIKNLNF